MEVVIGPIKWTSLISQKKTFVTIFVISLYLGLCNCWFRLKRTQKICQIWLTVVCDQNYGFCNDFRTIVEQLDVHQALVKQFAKILEFILKFDEYKMMNPAPGVSADFRSPPRPTAGPGSPRERFRFEDSAGCITISPPDTNSRAHSWANYDVDGCWDKM